MICLNNKPNKLLMYLYLGIYYIVIKWVTLIGRSAMFETDHGMYYAVATE